MRVIDGREFAASLITVLAVLSAVTCKGSPPAGTTPGSVAGQGVFGLVSDLRVESATQGSVVLSFTQVGDGVGQPADYAIGYGEESFTSIDQIASTLVAVDGTEVGASLEYEYAGLAAGTTYQFALAPYRGTLDENTDFGMLSNVVSATTEDDVGPPLGNDEPIFGIDPGDVVVTADIFDGYEDLDALRTGWGVSITSGNDVQMTADGGGRGGLGRAVLGMKNNETSGYTISRSISGSPRHLFVTFWFKMARQGESYGKWVIIRHDQEAQTGSRYEFPMATITTPERQQYARFLNRGETAGEDSPQNGDQGYYVWPGAPDPNQGLPIFSQDPLWGASPLNPANGGGGPIDNGNWHRQTIEIRVGNGTSGYNRLWLDGVLYWDSSTSTANMVGVPNSFQWATVSASSGSPYRVWYDDVMVWTR